MLQAGAEASSALEEFHIIATFFGHASRGKRKSSLLYSKHEPLAARQPFSSFAGDACLEKLASALVWTDFSLAVGIYRVAVTLDVCTMRNTSLDRQDTYHCVVLRFYSTGISV